MQTPDSSASGLPTALSAALGCLDVTLEDELALYRNQKNVKLLALSGHETSTEEAIAQHTRNVTEDRVPSPSDALDQDLEYQEPEVVYAELEARFTPQEEQPSEPGIAEGSRDAQPVVPDIAANSTPDSSLSVTAAQQREMEQALTHVKPEHIPPPEESAPPATTELPTPYGVEGNPLPESFEKFLDPSIDDYLESSEGLLKHLENSAQDTEERVQQSTQKSWKIAGLLGLGMGVLLSGIWLISGYFVLRSRRTSFARIFAKLWRLRRGCWAGRRSTRASWRCTGAGRSHRGHRRTFSRRRCRGFRRSGFCATTASAERQQKAEYG
jgi:hypothetical protein